MGFRARRLKTRSCDFTCSHFGETGARIASLSAVAIIVACDFDILPSGPGPDNSVPEVHGTPISSASSFSARITWSPSGEEVTFVAADLQTAYAYHLQSGALRELNTSTSNTALIYDAALSADGVDWFTTASGAQGDVIRRHTSTASTVLTIFGTYTPAFRGPAEGRAVLVAPGQPVAAFGVLPDSLFFLRRGNAPALLGTGCYGIVAFSPDESQVLCAEAGFQRGFRVFRADSGAAQSLDLPDEVAQRARLIRWDAQGDPCALYDSICLKWSSAVVPGRRRNGKHHDSCRTTERPSGVRPLR